jgi:hypothetical protein
MGSGSGPGKSRLIASNRAIIIDGQSEDAALPEFIAAQIAAMM